MRTLIWFRGKDLRISDHPALHAAAKDELVALFVLDPYFFGKERAKQLPHRMQFLLESLGSLEQNLKNRGVHLHLAQGHSTQLVPQLAAHWKVDRVVAQSWVEPVGRERDRRVKDSLGDRFELFSGETLIPAGSLRNKSGKPFGVFSPFARSFFAHIAIEPPQTAPRHFNDAVVPSHPAETRLPRLEALGLSHNSKLPKGGEKAARGRLRTFITQRLADYDTARDRMDLNGTSLLSQDLKFGTLSPRQVWHAVRYARSAVPSSQRFLQELLWREFAHDILWNRPDVITGPFQRKYQGFPWREDERSWRAWCEAETGYPIVDAAGRQLLQSGFVHNRARMISASFLTKHLLLNYRKGERHYLQYLVDGDQAQNNAGWQWSAGCGCDAQPYFRIFNPVSQGQKFDPDGNYVRRWLPELAALPKRFIHCPWEAPGSILEQAGVKLGVDYPKPIVEHRFARDRYLKIAKQHLKTSA